MRRDVTAGIELEAAGRARLVLAVAVADGHEVEESLVVSRDGVTLPWTEVRDEHGTRLHIVDTDAGRVRVDYRARVHGRAEPAVIEGLDAIRYLRPSRYCESDALRPVAVAEFGDLDGFELLEAVRAWVARSLAYVSGSSTPTDGAIQTLLSRTGVCRDFAHLVVAFLRALEVPARVVSVYAPGLSPMDFHAVAEAEVDGRWWVLDATGKAPRAALVRIATGRDAADTAFLTTIGADVSLERLEVTAVVDEWRADDGGPVALR